MPGKVTCSTCQKVWKNGFAYMSDRDKCGSESCPHLSSTKKVETTKRQPRVFLLKKELVQAGVWVEHTIPDKMKDEPRQLVYELPVPKVVTMALPRR